MCSEYLATGFADVDVRDDTTAYKQCLALLDSLPYFRQYKQRSHELLALSSGLTVLEVGCGLGDDALRMAELVGPNGLVVGVDTSARMIEEALGCSLADVRIRFAQADARNLPFKEGSFARCRVDRTLQHIKDPQRVIREMVRVLRPGGLLLAYDNDWGTFSVTGNTEENTRIIETLWEDSFTNRWIGRYLKHYFLEAGLQNVVIEPSVSMVTDFELADRIYNLRQTAKRAEDAGRLLPAAADEWVLEAQTLSRSGGFVCTLTAHTVVGIKPADSMKP
ncbi:MAG TPA: class I SAM-dependent methyltransferase [Syntrophobacteraceae bacterium]|nr:class I SAM-dependent methyltransferase [Syntrophobacteraceae bacterium]